MQCKMRDVERTASSQDMGGISSSPKQLSWGCSRVWRVKEQERAVQCPKLSSNDSGRKARQYSDETTTRRHTNNFVSDTLHTLISVHLPIHNIHYRQPWTRT